MTITAENCETENALSGKWWVTDVKLATTPGGSDYANIATASVKVSNKSQSHYQ